MNNDILKIAFNASTVAGNIVKNMNYTPSMSQPQLYSAYPKILFIPTIKLSYKLFQSDMNLLDKDIDKDAIKKIFLSTSQLNNFLERVQEKKQYEKLSLEEATKKGIIHNNIRFILNLFFSKGNKIHIFQKIFFINNYDWNNHYEMASVNSMMETIYKITINLTLHEGGELSFTDSTRLSCLQKRNSIVNDYYELLGLHKHQSLPKNLPLATAVPLARDVPVARVLPLSRGSPDSASSASSASANKNIRVTSDTKVGGTKKSRKKKN
tara:strand:- start:964 stop:1764 length:801 start_codon:yes stop_codon:yes gene_type:complete